MAHGYMTGTHGRTSPDEKMGHYSTGREGDAVERWQKEHDLYAEPKSATKQVQKDRAKNKRRTRDAQVIRQELDND
jgi:hypothetical protein